MDKIYSRPRIKLPKIFFNNSKIDKDKIRKIFTIIAILLIAFFVVKEVLDAVSPIFDTLCENKAKSIATVVTNEQTLKVMQNYSYDDLFTVEKDNDNKISLIKSNINNINKIVAQIALNVQKELDNKGREDISIALGSFTGLKLLSGRGPGVPIRISSIGSIETNLKSQFESQGVNQTLHKIYLETKCNVSVLTPFKDIQKEISTQVLLAENVIVGQIPNTYYNLEGIDQSDALKIIE